MTNASYYSIILPIFNVESQIPRCIRSLISQTDQDFELILVDDGGDDRSVEIAEKLLIESNRSYKIVSSKNEDGTVINQGAAAARNLGIREAETTWVQMLDSDDYLEPNTVEYAKKAISEHPEAELVFADFVFEKKGADTASVIKTPAGAITYTTKKFTGRELLKAFYFREEPIAAPACAFRKDFVEKNEIWFPEGCIFSEDMYFVYEMLFKVNTAVKVDASLYHYVERENSTMTSSGVERVLSGCEWFQKLTGDVTEKYKESGEEFGFQLQNILPRWVLAAAHTAAKVLSYEKFTKLISSMNYEVQMKKLASSERGKVRLAAKLLRKHPHLFYKIMKKR